MHASDGIPPWDLTPAIDLLKILSLSEPRSEVSPSPSTLRIPSEHSSYGETSLVLSQDENEELSLGNFNRIWQYLSLSSGDGEKIGEKVEEEGSDAEHVAKEVRWRDEVSGADLEDNVDMDVEDKHITAASVRTRDRAQRRARARERAEKAALREARSLDAVSDSADNRSDEDLERLRRSPDRRAVIQDILNRPSRKVADQPSPPTSPSPPKQSLRVLHKDWPISNPFRWSASKSQAGSHRDRLLPLGDRSTDQRKSDLLARLVKSFPLETKWLKNEGLIHPEFTPLNTDEAGVHVFVDISNIMIGFHDCLKLSRDIPISSRIRRVPMSFHSLSLVLERGRPAAKRVLVGSDKFPTIQQAKTMGYETNILERVHKVQELSFRQKDLRTGGGASGISSGSETNTAMRPREKWVEQAVDEILHLKILESLIDRHQPSTVVLATGDGNRSEYSPGFFRMVERALERNWKVELVSFKLNTSGAYKRKEFRSKWGTMFKWIQLDDYVEDLVDDQED